MYASYAYNYAEKNGPYKDGSLELEAISTSPYYSYMYARFVLNGRFPMGEQMIKSDALYSEMYTRYITKSKPLLRVVK